MHYSTLLEAPCVSITSNVYSPYLPPIVSSSWSEVQAIQPGSGSLAHWAQVPEHHLFAAFSTEQPPTFSSTVTYVANRSPTAGADDLDFRDASGKTRLHHAVIRGDFADVEDLLVMGYSLDVYDNNGNQPIHHAARGGFDGIILLLLKRGANVNARGPEGKTPVHLAVRSLKAILILLKYHPTLSLQDNEGNTALHTIFLSTPPHHSSSSKMLKKLIEAGAKVDVINNSGVTPLQLAIDPPNPLAEPCLSLAKVLLQNIATTSLLENDNKPLLQLLLNRSKIRWSPLRSAVSPDLVNKICKLMIQKGASLNIRLDSGELLLHEALLQTGADGDYELLQLLCENADVGAVAQNGNSTLHSCVTNLQSWRFPYARFIKALVKRGANLNQRNHLGDTPLTLALKSKAHLSLTEATKGLLECGADPMISDNTGDLPIYIAARQYNHDTSQSLIHLLAESYAETCSTRPLTSLGSYGLRWCTEYGKLLHDKHWHHATHNLVDTNVLPNDIAKPLSKLLLSIAAKKIFPFAQKTFRECKDELGLQHPNTRLAQAQLVLILRDCKALELNIDQSWYQFLLELFP